MTARPATDVDWGRVRAWGLYGGLTMAFIAAIGMVESLDARMMVHPVLSLGYLFLLWAPPAFGYAAAYEPVKEGMAAPAKGARDLVAGAVAGLLAGAVFGLFIVVAATFDLREVFVKLSPVLVDLLTFGRGVGFGVATWIVLSTGLGLAGGLLHVLPERGRAAVFNALAAVFVVALLELAVVDVLETFRLEAVERFLYAPNGGITIPGAVVVALVAGFVTLRTTGGAVLRFRSRYAAMTGEERRRFGVRWGLVAIAGLVVFPMIVGGLTNELLANVGLFLLMALGLNLVVGYAGLLDLGYVAFFAVGAYTTALLTSPLSPTLKPMFRLDLLTVEGWVVMAIVIAVAALSGLVIGTPVIRLRGDYLAIVTLGFGEIVRILFLSDWLAPLFGGAQGIRNIPPGYLGPIKVAGTSPQTIFYVVTIFVGIAIYVAWRLYHSRIGRAWAALREDEDVAEAMGIDTTRMKLLAFVTGAILASFSGMIFAVKVGSVFPSSFKLIVSIIVLVIVIVGGMGSIPGVVIGAVVLIGVLGGPTQPGLLAEFGEFKLLLYGVLLVVMMLRRPEGLWPSVQRQRELHQEEFLQDAWLKTEAAQAAARGEAAS